jgi:hypothetical protein
VIVVGTHQRRGFKRLMLGSVAAEVLVDARCPVLVAVTKDHSDESLSEQVEAACPVCVETRAQSGGQQYWCEQHSRAYLKPHVYEPSDQPRSSVS